MDYIHLELSELQIIQILNAISFFINTLTWNDYNMYNKKQIEKYFNFEPGEYANQLDNLIRLRELISLKANRGIYNIINDSFFIGQRQYLMYRKYDFLYDKKKFDKSIKLYIKNINRQNKYINFNNKKCEIKLSKKFINK